MSRKFILPAGVSVTAIKKKMQVSRGRRSKSKGKLFEKTVAAKQAALMGVNPEDVTRTRSGTSDADVALHYSIRQRFPYLMELKNHKTISVHDWLRQVKKAAQRPENAGLTPIVIFKQHGDGQEFVIVSYDHFMELALHYHKDTEES